MEVMVSEKKPNKTREQWRQATTDRLKPPEVSLRNYGGHPLNIIAQIRLQLRQGDHMVDTMVLVNPTGIWSVLLRPGVQAQQGETVVRREETSPRTQRSGSSGVLNSSHLQLLTWRGLSEWMSGCLLLVPITE